MTTTPTYWQVERQDSVTVATFSGPRQLLEDSDVQEAGGELLGLVEPTYSRLVVNLKNLRFMNSSMLGRFMHLNTACKTKSISLALCNISVEIMEVFKITRMNKYLAIFDGLEQACKLPARGT